MLGHKLLSALIGLPLLVLGQIAPPFDMHALRERMLGNASIANRLENTVVDLWFDEAILDHNDTSAGHWSQRYHYNDAYYGGAGSPVFLYINGEWEASSYTVSDRRSTMVDLAIKHKAMIVAVEHRYYGDSIPNGDQSEASMRKYHSSTQALADLATFHAFFTKKHNLQDARWIAWGYSYAGQLSAWFKLKYPSLVAGAVASSAPVQASFDHKAYMEGVTRGLKYHGGQSCLDNFESAINDFHALVVAGGNPLRTKFGTCGATATLQEKQAIEWEVMSYYHGIGQSGRDHGYSIKDVCDYMADPANGQTPMDRMSKWKLAIYHGCAPVSRALRQAADPDFGQWTWQTCNEFGFLITASTGDNTPFRGLAYASPENVHRYSPCTTRFHVDAATLQANVDATNAKYGGWDIDVENVIFTNGAIDPWSGLSVTKQPKNPKSRFVVIEGATHCEDAYLSYVDGPMKDAIKMIGDAVADFLADAPPAATAAPTKAPTEAPTPAPTTKLVTDAPTDAPTPAPTTKLVTPAPTTKMATPAPTSDAMCGPVEKDTDYYGNDVAAIPRASAADCCADCKATPGCKLYVWNRHNGGTCWLKSKKGARSVYPGAVAGTVDVPLVTEAPVACPPMEMDTDYYGNDIAAIRRASADSCCADCKATPGCKLYVWNLHNGGTCWLKSKKGARTTYYGAKAGVIDAPADDQCPPMEHNTDYYGNDIASVPRKSADDCCADCRKTPGCKVYVWNLHNGGTCWLKSQKGTRSTYHGAMAGVVDAAPTTCAIEANIDYYGNDVAAIPRASSDNCCGDCHATAGCSVWVWNRHNGGTCWLKSKKGNRSVYHGAIAGSIRA